MPDPDGGLTSHELRERHGAQYGYVPSERVIKLMGREDIDPDQAWGGSYATMEAFEAFADGNKRHHGHDTIGPVTGSDGIIYGLTVLRMPEGHETAVAELTTLAEGLAPVTGGTDGPLAVAHSR